MWPKLFDSKIFNLLFSAALTILTVILAQSFIAKREYEQTVKVDIEKKASIEQVNDLQKYVDKQDLNITNSINQHIMESNKSDANMMQLIQSIDNKINILITRK